MWGRQATNTIKTEVQAKSQAGPVGVRSQAACLNMEACEGSPESWNQLVHIQINEKKAAHMVIAVEKPPVEGISGLKEGSSAQCGSTA